jgi:hypothetical protein
LSVLSFKTRLSRLETTLRPPGPTMEEYTSATDRWLARGERWMRELFSGWLEQAGIEVTEETGTLIDLPSLWSPDNIAETDALLVGDTEEQARQDEDIRRRWCKSTGRKLHLDDDPAAQDKEARVLGLIDQLIASATNSNHTKGTDQQ